jgi:type IV secretory pathway VirB9-like protein
MKSASVLKEMNQLKEAWRKQNLSFNTEQKRRYEELLQLRRERVSQLQRDGKVWVKPSAAALKKEAEAKAAAAKAAEELEDS